MLNFANQTKSFFKKRKKEKKKVLDGKLDWIDLEYREEVGQLIPCLSLFFILQQIHSLHSHRSPATVDDGAPSFALIVSERSVLVLWRFWRPSMDKVLHKLRNLDAYPKVNEDFYSRTLAGGVVTVVSAAVMLFLFFSELSMTPSSCLLFYFKCQNFDCFFVTWLGKLGNLEGIIWILISGVLRYSCQFVHSAWQFCCIELDLKCLCFSAERELTKAKNKIKLVE